MTGSPADPETPAPTIPQAVHFQCTASQIGRILTPLVAEGTLGLQQMGQIILEAHSEEEEDETLVDSGYAHPVLCSLLQHWAENASSPEAPAAAWKQSGLELVSFLSEVCLLN